MAGGRPPKPVELKRLEGNPGKRKLREPTLIGGRGLPKPPASLKGPARRIFTELVKSMAQAGVLDTADAPMLEAVAVSMANARAARVSIDRDGVLVERQRSGRDGSSWVNLEPNPAIKIEREAWSEARQVFDRIGIGPVARARLAGFGIEGQTAENAIAGLAEIHELRAVRG